MLLYIFFIVGIVVCELFNDEMLNNVRCMFGFFLIFMYLWCLKVFFVDRIMGLMFIMNKEMVCIFNVIFLLVNLYIFL